MLGLKCDYFRTLFVQCCLILIAFANQVVLARALGTDLRGSFAVCWSFLSILIMLSGFGVRAANVYNLATAKCTISQVLATSIWIALFGEAVALLLGYTAINLPLKFFQKAAKDEFSLAIIIVGLFVFSMYLISILRGSMRYKAMNAIRLLGPVIALAATFLFCSRLELGVKGALMGAMCAPLVIIIGTPVIIKNNLHLKEMMTAYRLIPTTLHYGFRAYLGYFASTMNLQIGTFILAFLLPTSQVGFYAIAVSIVSRLWIIPDSLSMVLLPKLAQNKILAADATCQALRIMLPLVSIAGLGLGMISHPFIIFGLGKSFEPTFAVLSILIAGAVLRSATKIITSYLLSIDLPGLNSVIKLLCIGLNIVLPFILVPHYGLIGGAWATSLSYVLESIIMVLVFMHVSGIKSWRLLILQKRDLAYFRNNIYSMVFRYKA